MTFALAAAGTAGHVYPALAVARALTALGVPREAIVFLGGDRMEASAVPAAGFEFVPFAMPRLRRAPTPSNLAIPWRLSRVTAAMTAEMRHRGTRVVLGTSGYATVPAARAAARLGLPMFVQEQNAAPGLAARYAARRARATFLGLPGPAERLARSRVVGNPLREVFETYDRSARRSAALARYGVDPRATVIGVLGGSLGAKVLNDAVPGIARALAGRRCEIVHLTGRAAHDEVARRAVGSPLPWRCVAFEDAMEHFYAAADLVVCRAGAMTISELAATGSAAVVVPLEAVGQQANAAALAAAGGALVVRQDDAASLPDVVAGLAADTRRLERMRAASAAAALPHAASMVAGAMLEAADG
ncbi:MAG: glycosyltransferase [Actinobacteria bacterium]|nr:glycosyltransferase [Actinomycetota bacterium]